MHMLNNQGLQWRGRAQKHLILTKDKAILQREVSGTRNLARKKREKLLAFIIHFITIFQNFQSSRVGKGIKE